MPGGPASCHTGLSDRALDRALVALPGAALSCAAKRNPVGLPAAGVPLEQSLGLGGRALAKTCRNVRSA